MTFKRKEDFTLTVGYKNVEETYVSNVFNGVTDLANSCSVISLREYSVPNSPVLLKPWQN
jgi:hypothetical protein